MRSMILTGTVFVLLALVGLIFLTRSAPAEHTEPLTNQDIIAMTRLGLEADVLLSALNHHELDLDVSPHGIVQLRQHAVPDAVIEAIIEIASTDEVALTQDRNRVRRLARSR